MFTGTILVVLFTPLFYVMIEKTFGRHGRDLRAAGNGMIAETERTK